MGLFGKKKATADDLLALQARLSELERQLQVANERVATCCATTSARSAVEAIDQHAKVVDRFERLERDHALLVHDVDLVEARVGARQDALAHRLDELGRDVDTLADLPSTRDGAGARAVCAPRRPRWPTSRPASRSPCARTSPSSPISFAASR